MKNSSDLPTSNYNWKDKCFFTRELRASKLCCRLFFCFFSLNSKHFQVHYRQYQFIVIVYELFFRKEFFNFILFLWLLFKIIIEFSLQKKTKKKKRICTHIGKFHSQIMHLRQSVEASLCDDQPIWNPKPEFPPVTIIHWISHTNLRNVKKLWRLCKHKPKYQKLLFKKALSHNYK